MTVTTTPPESEESPDTPIDITEISGPNTERSPVYVLSLVVAVFVFLVGLFLALADKSALVGFESDVVEFFHKLPNPFERFLIGLSQFVAVLYPIVLVTLFVVLRRPLGLLIAAVAGTAAGFAVWGLEQVLETNHPAALQAAQTAHTWIVGSAFPDYVYVGVASALAVVVGAEVGRRWRHVAWVFVGAVVVFRIVAGANVPVDLAIAIAIGWACGDIALLAFGSPIHRSTGHDIAVAMARSGYPLSRIAPASVDARGSTPWFATTQEHGPAFVKVLGRDERDADLVFRLYRYLRLKNVGDQRPFSDLRRTVEHEALLALKARDSGVRTPHLLTVATVDPDGLLLAYEMIEGKSLDGIPAPWSDELLRGIWEQVAILRRERIAHRDLRRANIFVDPDGTPWIIDFGFSELAATDDMLNQDAAQLLAASVDHRRARARRRDRG